MTAKAMIDGREVEYCEESKKWVFSDDKTEVPKNAQTEMDLKKKKEDEIKSFGEKLKAFEVELRELGKKYDVGMLVGAVFKEEKQFGILKADLTELEQLGLAKRIEQQFVA